MECDTAEAQSLKHFDVEAEIIWHVFHFKYLQIKHLKQEVTSN